MYYSSITIFCFT